MANKIEFKVSKNDIQQALLKVVKVVSDKSTIPVYTYILFEIKDKVLYLTGNNQEIQIETSIPIMEDVENVSFCLDKPIVEILKTLPEQPITFIIEETEEDTCTRITAEVKHNSGKIELQGFPADDYTKMQDEDCELFVIPADKLKRGFDKTKKFAGTDPMKKTQSTIYVDIVEDGVVFVATTGEFLSRFKDKSINGGKASSFMINIIAANIISSLLGEAENDEVIIKSGQSNTAVDLGNIKITSMSIEGIYPKYNSVFPASSPIQFNADSKSFSTIISRLLIAADIALGAIKITTAGNEVLLNSSDVYYNRSAEERIKAECQGNITIGIKGNLLTTMLSVIEGNTLFTFSEPLRPIIIKPEIDDEDTELTLLSMPIMFAK